MSLGSLAGAFNLIIPGAEAMILLSCLTLSALIVRGIGSILPSHRDHFIVCIFSWLRTWTKKSPHPPVLFLYRGFRICHFAVAWRRHLISQLLLLLITFCQHRPQCSRKIYRLIRIPQNQMPILTSWHIPFWMISVHGRADKLIGIADSASQGKIGQDQIRYRPIIRPEKFLKRYRD